MRTEHDFLGTMDIDDDVYYGIQTVRGMAMSGVSGHSIGEDGKELIYAIAEIKKAAARANQAAGGLEPDCADAICAAADEILEGRWDDQFPVDMISGGGGISIHMNVNEVIARRASELSGNMSIHPNTHVNMGQSTNDVLPAAMHIACIRLMERIADRVDELDETVRKKADETADVCKLGRTCLQDALPVALGQDIAAWSAFLKRQSENLRRAAKEMLALPLGGTAVGTGAGMLPGYKEVLYDELRLITGLELKPSENFFDGLQNNDVFIRASGELKALAAGLSKTASDIRLMASGPSAGIREVSIPTVLPGSSIMPGKMNPVLPELMIQVYFLVFGNDAAITLACERGELELNVWEAVIVKCFFESARLLERSIPLFCRYCIAGITADRERCLEEIENSAAMSAMVSAVFGYETGSEAAREAVKNGRSIRNTVVDMGLLDKAAADELFDPRNMTDADRMSEVIADIRKRTGAGRTNDPETQADK